MNYDERGFPVRTHTHKHSDVTGSADAAGGERCGVCGKPSDSVVHCGSPHCGRASHYAASHHPFQPAADAPGSTPPPASLVQLVAEQAEDEGLWFLPASASERYLQAALRRIHTVVEATPAAPVGGVLAEDAITSIRALLFRYDDEQYYGSDELVDDLNKLADRLEGRNDDPNHSREDCARFGGACRTGRRDGR